MQLTKALIARPARAQRMARSSTVKVQAYKVGPRLDERDPYCPFIA